MPSRALDGHKGDYGRVLVVGGSRGMIGAAALASNAALRGGAGLVTVAAAETVQLAVACLCPCATSVPLSCEADGSLSALCLRELNDAAGRCDVLAVGPGMAVGVIQKNIVQAALEGTKPLVLDADALNNLAGLDGWATIRNCPVVLTPHPGEFARLRGLSVEQIQSNRERSAVEAAREWNRLSGPGVAPLVCVLKGAGSVVTDGRRAYVNKTGNPGMASGGSGDVLTGLTAALIGQGLEPFDAACLAVHLHGAAGDLAARSLGQHAMISTDLLEFLPAAIKRRSG